MQKNMWFWIVVSIGVLVLVFLVAYYWRDSAKKAAFKNALFSDFGKHAAIIIGLLLLAWGAAKVSDREAEDFAAKWTSQLAPQNADSLKLRDDLLVNDSCFTPTVVARLKSQFQEVQGRAKHHLGVMTVFYRNYYIAIIMVMIFGAIAAIAVFYIANKGWEKASPYMVNVFTVATVVTAFYGAFPSVFKQQDNITDNKHLYLRYIALENEITSYAATGAIYLDKKDAKAEDFVHHVDEQMEAFNDIAIGLDYGKIPSYKGIFSTEPAKSTSPQTRTNDENGTKGIPKKKSHKAKNE